MLPRLGIRIAAHLNTARPTCRSLFNLGATRRPPDRTLTRGYVSRSQETRRGATSQAQAATEMARQMEAFRAKQREGIVSWSLYVGSIIIFMSGLSYAAVPLYKLVCSVTSIDGTPKAANLTEEGYNNLRPVAGAKKLRIHFNADVSQTLSWKFQPQTRQINVVPGETALAFYTATNNSPEDIIGISTYSVVPAKAAQYFNKIQCFCFEEQKLLAKESVDMPVYFYIDPAFASDPWMQDVDDITLSYTFFKSKGT